MPWKCGGCGDVYSSALDECVSCGHNVLVQFREAPAISQLLTRFWPISLLLLFACLYYLIVV